MTRPDGRPWRKYRDVRMKQTFEELPGNRVRVTADDGRWGVFEAAGPWVEGELTQANVHMLTWCGGPDVPKACAYRWNEVPADINRPSGWPEELEKTLGSTILGSHKAG